MSQRTSLSLTRTGAALLLGLALLLASRAGRAEATLEIPSPLTLDRALALFKTHGFDLLIADASVQSAQGELEAAGAVPNPAVDATIGHTFAYNPSSCAGCSATPWSVGISDSAALLDIFSNKRGLRRDVAHAALAAARLSRGDAERTLTLQLRQQFVAALSAKAALTIAREVQKSTEETERLVEVRFKAGAISEADVARAKTAALDAAQATDGASQIFRQARVGLAFLLGSRDVAPDFDVAGALFDDTGAAIVSDTEDALVRAARAHRPDLASGEQQVARARASVALSGRQLVPDIAFNVQYSQEGVGDSALQPPTLTFGLSTPLPIAYQQQGEIRKAQADLLAQQLTLAKLDAQVASDVGNAYAAYKAAESRLSRMREGLLDQAARARDLTRIQYEKGAASLLELLDAQRQYVAVSAERIQILTDLWSAVFQLEAAVGTELKS